MKDWKENDDIDFNFYDAHDIRPLTDCAPEEIGRECLSERMSSAKQVIVLVGEHTKNLYKFVLWEIDLAMKKDLPVIVANINGRRDHDPKLCPPILQNHYAVHLAFKKSIIKYALNNFPDEYEKRDRSVNGTHHYIGDIYSNLGL
jgi:hypothetical protein